VGPPPAAATCDTSKQEVGVSIDECGCKILLFHTYVYFRLRLCMLQKRTIVRRNSPHFDLSTFVSQLGKMLTLSFQSDLSKISQSAPLDNPNLHVINPWFVLSRFSY
jgi:hypothetical protein